MEKLPTEIPSNIFSRLPFDSVMQCKCVSKSWYNLIQLLIHTSGDLYFAQTHRSRLIENHKQHQYPPGFVLLLLDQSVVDNHQGLHFVDYENEESNGRMAVKKFNSPLTMDSKFWTMACSSNGLICSSVRVHQYDDNDSSYLFYIYNPFLRQYVTLPNLKSTESYSMAFGFGYVPSTGEYKVVRIFYPLGRDDGDSTVGNVEVYTLGKMNNSTSSTHPHVWRSKGNIEHRLQVSSPGVLVNGSLHWLTEKVLPDDDQKVKQHDILAFDLAKEEFRTVPLPPPELLTNFQIKEMGGCLYGIDYKDERLMEMWIIKESYCEQIFWIQWIGGLKKGFEECFYWNKVDEVLLWSNSSLIHVEYDMSLGPNLDGKDGVWAARVFHGIPHIKSFISLKALGEDNVLTIKT